MPAPVTLTVHTKSLEHCPQCDMTLRTARRYGVHTEEAPGIDTPERADELAAFKARRDPLLSAPVVIVTDDATGAEVDAWAGFRPDKIQEYMG